MSGSSGAGVLIDHLFRHQAGRITAHLVGALGPARLGIAEEAVQDAMLRALQTWPFRGIPENPVAWLFRVAQNAAIDAVRRRRREGDLDGGLITEFATTPVVLAAHLDFDEQLRDDELRMVFMCSHPEIPSDSSVALSLKLVGGFSVREIARAFLAEDATIAQRLVRAKAVIRNRHLTLDLPGGGDLRERLGRVLDVIYLIFNEGYAVHEGEDLIRTDLCAEALRLGRLVAASSLSENRVHALVAAMALQAARLPARVDAAGELVLLEDQDRSLWDRRLISLGFHHFDLSIGQGEVTEFHLQAAIAATHVRASSLESTEWNLILGFYDELLEMTASPIVALNRAVAVSKVHGPGEALAAIEAYGDDPQLRHYHLAMAVRGRLLAELERNSEAAVCFRAALDCRCSEPERRFLRRKLAECESGGGTPVTSQAG